MDARVRFTKNAIQESVLSLLKETDISRITVKAICDRAQINRATFYKYYDNPQDFLQKLEMELLDELHSQICRIRRPSLAEIFRAVLEDIHNKKEMYLPLFSEHGDEEFKQRLFAFCYQDNIETIRACFPELPENKQEWLFYFVAEGCVGVLNFWIADGMSEAPEEIVAFLTGTIDAINRTDIR